MSKKNGQHTSLAEQVKAALVPKPPRIMQFTMTVAYDTQKGAAGVSFVSAQSGMLNIADLYQAVEAARRHVMQMEQQSILQQAAAQQAQPGATGQLAEAVTAEGGRQ